MLCSVAAVATPGLVTGIVSFLQDKLLALELRILVPDPAERDRIRGSNGVLHAVISADQDTKAKQTQWCGLNGAALCSSISSSVITDTAGSCRHTGYHRHLSVVVPVYINTTKTALKL